MTARDDALRADLRALAEKWQAGETDEAATTPERLDDAEVEALAEDLWADSALPGASPTDAHRDLARAVLASDWLAQRVARAVAEARAERRAEALRDHRCKPCGCAWCCANVPTAQRGELHQRTCRPYRADREGQS
jgi:hypothetical protein